MSELVFSRNHALEAINRSAEHGRDWLYKHYPKPDGQTRKSSTGFLIHDGQSYPVKPLGRLANEIAGTPMADNPITDVFRRYFESLRFQLTDDPDADAEAEAEQAAERQRKLASIWDRPGQARFRQEVFELFGTKCIVTGCEELIALEAAHVVPVHQGGCDSGWNGIPLRADVHRLFDAGVIRLSPDTWRLVVDEDVGEQYQIYHDKEFLKIDLNDDHRERFRDAIRARSNHSL